MAIESTNQGYIDAQAYAGDPSNADVPDSTHQEYEQGVKSFQLANQEGLVADGNGNLLVGKTTSNFNVAGQELSGANGVSFTRDGATPLSLNRLTDDGPIFSLSQAGTEEGQIGVAGTQLYLNATDSLGFNTVGTEKARLTNLGVLLQVEGGSVPPSSAAIRHVLANPSEAFTQFQDTTGNRGAYTGLLFDGSYAVGTCTGAIGAETYTERVRVDLSGNLLASGDNTQTLGGASNRWSEVFAGNGTINTSDEREKTQISVDQKVIDAVNSISIKAFKWNNAIEEKGDDARIHYGVIAQEVKEAFEAQGLVAEDYGVLCYDEWDDVYETKVTTKGKEAVFDEDGKIVEPAVEEVTEEVLVKSAGNRYGVRYDELYAMKIAALEARIAALESA